MSHLTSDSAACCWIPLFALRCETTRRPELAVLPVALLAPDDARRLWQVSPLARHAGVKPGMTVSQAIGVCPALKLCEPDPVHYDAQFARLLTALSSVSPVVEPVELGRAYVGTDGLEGVYGSPASIIEEMQVRTADWGLRIGNSSVKSAIRNPQSAIRVGWGRGKFISWVAAPRAKPGDAVIVPVGGEAKFLASQPIAVLPLDPDTYRRLRQLGIKTLGGLAALPEDAVVSQFGRTGRQLWQLAAGRIVEPGGGRGPGFRPPGRALGAAGGRTVRRAGGGAGRARADCRRARLLLSSRRARVARAGARPPDRASAQKSAPQRLAGAGGTGPCRARARRVVARGSDAQGPVRR